MASLVPHDFDLSQLEMSEQRVARSFLDHLGDEWLVIPHVPVRIDKRDGEIDLVAVSPTRGALVVEVKGGRIQIIGGQWRQYGHPIGNPFSQVVAAKHSLVRHLKTCGVDLRHINVEHAVALPDATAVPSTGLGPDARPQQVFTAYDLENPKAAIDRVQSRRGPATPEVIHAFVKALRPDITLSVEQGRYFDLANAAIESSTFDRLSSVLSLDANKRVLVEGGAGTGKTWLVQQWARRAVDRGERTAVVCFNRPIADRMQQGLEGTGAVVDTYHGLAVQLLEPLGFEVPENPDASWWRKGPTKALQKRRNGVGTPFDTIIIDEAQDLRPKWLDSLRRLLDPDGAGRLLMAMDPAQAIYVDDWADPEEFFGITLDVNLRNSRAIGALCSDLGGPRAMQANPDGRPPRFVLAKGPKELRKRVRDEIDGLIRDDGVPASEIAVVTTRRKDRDRLIAEVHGDRHLARWEDRTTDAVLCETIHRIKGLEWTAVILATLDEPVDPQLLYIGASRARMHLTLIGPAALGAVLQRSS